MELFRDGHFLLIELVDVVHEVKNFRDEAVAMRRDLLIEIQLRQNLDKVRVLIDGNLTVDGELDDLAREVSLT